MTTGPMLSIDEKLASFDLATGQDACERLLSIDGLPPDVDARTRQRMVELAPSLAAVAPAARSLAIRIATPGGWPLHEASIARGRGGFGLLARSANFSRHRDGSRIIHDARGVARSRNYWVGLSPDYRVRAVHAIHEHGLQSGDIEIPSSGLLHGRPVFQEGAWTIVGAIGDAESDQTVKPLLARLDGDWLRDTSLLGGGDGREVWWMPVVPQSGEPLRFLTSLAPTVVTRPRQEAGGAEIASQHAAPLIARRLRAATQVIPADEGYLGLAIERVANEDRGQMIVHRWVGLDADFALARLSRPFVLHERTAGFAAGLDRDGGDLVISFVREDGCLGLTVVPEGEVLGLLAPPLELDLEAIEQRLEGEASAVPGATRRRSRKSTLRPALKPTIASMTITGSNRDIVGDALRSVVDWVDWCVLIDTGIDDDTIDIVREIVGAKLIVREFPWCNDFSAARNFALAAAAETGATWAVFVDSDERLVLNDVDIHQVLASTPEASLLVPLASGEYTKDRFFRLPVTGEFLGATHEAFYITPEIGGATVTIPGVVFDELVKSPARMRLKDERDRDILQRYTEEHPEQPRWFFYLGDVLMRLGQHDEAITAFRACHALHGWDEESAWAMYRATQCYFELNRLEDALEATVLGMARHAGLADFPWFAGLISLRLGRPQQAVFWARHSIALGWFEGIGQTVHRIGWRYPYALWEGPYDILRDALKQLGDHAGAAEADRQFNAAAAARKAFPG